MVDHSACGSSKTVASYVLDMGMAYYCLTGQLNAHCTLVQSIGGGGIPHVHGTSAQVHGTSALIQRMSNMVNVVSFN